MIEPIGASQAAAAAAAATGGASPAAGASDTIDQQEFLLLFIAQLQNQDPLDPLDVNGLTNQLAQFSSLEQLFNINGNLGALNEALTSREHMDPLRLLGTDVTVAGDAITLAEGESTPLVIDVPQGTAALTVSIVGPSGTTVREIDLGAPVPGELTFAFDGKDAHGATLPDGTYTAEVVARDAADEVLATETFMQGAVTGVDLRAEPPVLLLGERRVALGDVHSIRTVPADGEDD
jgi:flagellar basal-body rod modification protein FlgD